MFTYSCLSIDSAIPIREIYDYFAEIGATSINNSTFTYQDLEIGISSSACSTFPSINIKRHNITVLNGERTAAEGFLTDFRIRFLSAGG